MSFSEVPLIILYRSGTVVGVTECVWSGIRALSSSQNTTELLLMPAMKNENALWVP